MGGAAMRFVLNLGNGCELYDSARTHPFATTASIVLMVNGLAKKRFVYVRGFNTSRNEAIEKATNYQQSMNNGEKIEVKDLRIGNMVWRPIDPKNRDPQVEDHGQYGRVTNIGPRQWMCDNRVKGIMCKPIPLSDRLFTDFGFGRCYLFDRNRIAKGFDPIFHTGDLPMEARSLEVKNGIFIIYRPDWMLCAYDLISAPQTSVIYLGKVEYVHQLQNKCYALTEEDLLYKP